MPHVGRSRVPAAIASASAEEHARAETEHRQIRPRTAEDIHNEQTAEQLALRIWAATAAGTLLSGMSALADELIQSQQLDDDDEEGDEGWLDDHQKREKRFLDEAIADGLDRYPDINANQQSSAEFEPGDCPIRRAAESRAGEVRHRGDQVQGEIFTTAT
jgi:hypothetical protein